MAETGDIYGSIYQKRANEILAAGGLKVSAVQNHFSLLHRSSEPSGLIEELAVIGTSFKASPAQIATAWAIAKGTLPIIGVTKTKQVEEAAQAARITLTAEEVCRLEKLGDETGVHILREWEK